MNIFTCLVWNTFTSFRVHFSGLSICILMDISGHLCSSFVKTTRPKQLIISIDLPGLVSVCPSVDML